jgi:dipeptidyl aminopeptidase/acylaminoacyl peptidase
MARKKLLTAEDLWRVKRPASPALSPDGAQACVSVASYDMDENKATSHLWLLSTFGGAPRELTQCGEKDGAPQWSPDGSKIAFVAKRGDDEPQIYLIAPDGGEAKRLTNIATGVASVKWFPGGKKIAFISWVWPGAKTEKEQAAQFKARKENKVEAIVTDQLLYRYWDHWLADGRVPCVHEVDIATGKVRNLFAGTPYELPIMEVEAKDYDISPDGRFLAFNFNPSPDKRSDRVHRIIEMELRTGKVVTLVPNTRLNLRYPAYSPDGNTIAVLANDVLRAAMDGEKLAVIDVSTSRSGGNTGKSTDVNARGKLTVVSGRWDRILNGPLKWSPCGSSVLFTADDRTRLSLWQWRLGDDEPAIVAPGGTVTEFDVRGDSIVFVRTNMSSPPKVFASDLNGSRTHAVETFNDALMDEFAFGEVRDVTIKGWNNEPVQMWVVYPPNFDAKKKWPLLHSIHGGPHSNWGDNFHFRWNNHAFAAQGYVVVCVNYHGSAGFGQAFLESIVGRLGEKEHADVEAATDYLLKQGYIDADRMVATGGSYGGMMVAWMNGRNGANRGGDRYKAYVCHAGCFDWVSLLAEDVSYYFPHELKATYWDDPAKVAAQNPITAAKHMNTPTLVMHGALDYRVPDNQGMAYYNTLKVRGVPAKLVLFPDENHWILKPQNSRLWYREFFAWIGQYTTKQRGERRGVERGKRATTTRARGKST